MDRPCPGIERHDTAVDRAGAGRDVRGRKRDAAGRIVCLARDIGDVGAQAGPALDRDRRRGEREICGGARRISAGAVDVAEIDHAAGLHRDRGTGAELQRADRTANRRHVAVDGRVGQVDDGIDAIAHHHIGRAGEAENAGDKAQQGRELGAAGHAGVDGDGVGADADVVAGHRAKARQRDRRRRAERDICGAGGDHAVGVHRDRAERRQREDAVTALRGDVAGDRVVGEEARRGGVAVAGCPDNDGAALNVVDDRIRVELRAARDGHGRRLVRDRRRPRRHGGIDLRRRTDADRRAGEQADTGAGQRSGGADGAIRYAGGVERDAAPDIGIAAGIRRSGEDLAAGRRNDGGCSNRDVSGIG